MSHEKRKSFTRKKISQEKKKTHVKRNSLTEKEKVSRQKKISHVERKIICLTLKENLSHQKKTFHNKARNKLKTTVINKTIYCYKLSSSI